MFDTVDPQFVSIIGGASATIARSSKSRFAIDKLCLVRANHTGHARKRSSPWRRPLTVKDQAAGVMWRRLASVLSKR